MTSGRRAVLRYAIVTDLIPEVVSNKADVVLSSRLEVGFCSADEDESSSRVRFPNLSNSEKSRAFPKHVLTGIRDLITAELDEKAEPEPFFSNATSGRLLKQDIVFVNEKDIDGKTTEVAKLNLRKFIRRPTERVTARTLDLSGGVVRSSRTNPNLVSFAQVRIDLLKERMSELDGAAAGVLSLDMSSCALVDDDAEHVVPIVKWFSRHLVVHLGYNLFSSASFGDVVATLLVLKHVVRVSIVGNPFVAEQHESMRTLIHKFASKLIFVLERWVDRDNGWTTLVDTDEMRESIKMAHRSYFKHTDDESSVV